MSTGSLQPRCRADGCPSPRSIPGGRVAAVIRPLLATLVVMALASAGCDTTLTPPPTSLDAHVHEDAAHEVSVDVRDVVRPPDAPSRCVNGSPLPYPEASPRLDLDATLGDLSFPTATGAVTLREHYAPCAARPRLLVLRTLGAWSGPSQHAAAHTGRLLAHPQADRVTLVDLLALGPDNTPATPADLAAWSALYDRVPTALAVDPDYRFRALYLTAGELPLYAFIDTRSRRVYRVLTVPSSEELAYELTALLAELDGMPRPRAQPPTLYDGRLTADQREMLQAMAPVIAPPPDPTNRYADATLAVSLGARIFRDTALSSSGMVSCGTCHDAAMSFVDGRPQGVGVARGDRNTPTVFGAAYTRWRFWDGRVDTLWAQALGPIENPLEMNLSRLAAVRHVLTTYAADYAAVFGAVPDLSRLPASGAPGDPAWEALPEADRDLVNRHFANIGKAVAAFERTRRPADGRLRPLRHGRGRRAHPRAAQRGSALLHRRVRPVPPRADAHRRQLPQHRDAHRSPRRHARPRAHRRHRGAHDLAVPQRRPLQRRPDAGRRTSRASRRTRRSSARSTRRRSARWRAPGRGATGGPSPSSARWCASTARASRGPPWRGPWASATSTSPASTWTTSPSPS